MHDFFQEMYRTDSSIIFLFTVYIILLLHSTILVAQSCVLCTAFCNASACKSHYFIMNVFLPCANGILTFRTTWLPVEITADIFFQKKPTVESHVPVDISSTKSVQTVLP